MTYETRKALRKLDHAIEYLRPRCNRPLGELRIINGRVHATSQGNAENEACALLGGLMCDVVREVSRNS